MIKINLRKIPWVLDRPLELVGMQDYPAAFEGGSFNVRKTASLHIFLYAPETPTHFAILRAEVDKVPLTFLKADTFLPFVDRFGQFIHDDWPGKIHDEAELQQAKEREAAWLAANAEGPTKNRNAWGGWTAGPQLKATGHFRTEKIDGMWWLVDPVGRLFFSHGVDCVTVTYGGDAMTPITHRENYFAWLPEKGAPLKRFTPKTPLQAASTRTKALSRLSILPAQTCCVNMARLGLTSMPIWRTAAFAPGDRLPWAVGPTPGFPANVARPTL